MQIPRCAATVTGRLLRQLADTADQSRNTKSSVTRLTGRTGVKMIRENLSVALASPPYSTSSTRRDLVFDIGNERVNLVELGEIYHDALADHLTYYLGEFILKLPLMPYYYTETTESRGQRRLNSPGFGENDILKHFAQPYLIKEGLIANELEAIETLLDLLPPAEAKLNRHAAEAKGFHELRKLIFSAEDESLIVWISPPINPDGYSLTYLGQINRIGPAKRLLQMLACVNHLTLTEHQEFLKQFNLQIQSADKKNVATSPLSTEDFLLSPFILSPEAQKELDIDQLDDLLDRFYQFENENKNPGLNVQLNPKSVSLILRRIKEKAVNPHLPAFLRQISARAEKCQIDEVLDQMELAAVRISLPTLIDQPAAPLSEKEWNLQAAAFLAFSRKEMPKDGGSCPAVNRQDNLMTSVNELINVLSGDEEPQKCENCAEIRRNHPDAGCCKGCRYK